MTNPPADTPAGAPPPATHDAGLVDLIRRPYVAEVLAALDDRPHTLAGLRHATGAPRRAAVAALRALAGHHAVTRLPATGSWDTTADTPVRYQLTDAGHRLIERLFDLNVWAALYRNDG